MIQQENNKIQFKIENKDFFCDADLVKSDEFIIQSVPRAYSVTFDENNNPFLSISNLLKKNKKNLLIIDKKLIDIYKPQFPIEPERVFLAEANEAFKTLESATAVLDFLQKNEFTKGEQLIVVGGGIIQDISAFVGAIYKRGISWVHFPTTLLAMCDSCIGGKAGVNYNGVKNQLALFSAPSAIYINQQFLKTLSDNEINSGLGEILKLCIIAGDYFIALYKSHVINGKVKSFSSFKNLIMASLCVKKSVVEEDEFELNHRRSLNYGHTLGHAIEALSGYEIPHGQAVVVGMILVNEISHAQGLLSKENLIALNTLCFDLINEQVSSCLKKICLNSIVSIIQKDKKTIGKLTSFVLLKSPGDICITTLELNEKLLSDIQYAFNKMVGDSRQ